MTPTPNAKRIHEQLADWYAFDAERGAEPLSASASEIARLFGIPIPSVRRALLEHSAWRRDRTRPWLFLARDVSTAESAVGVHEIRWTAPPAEYLERLRRQVMP